MQIGRRVMLRLLGLMGLGFLIRRLGTAEDVYATATPTPTPAPMQAVLNTGQTVRDTLYRLLHEGSPWHKISDPNKDNTDNVHKTLDGWDHASPPATYDDLAKDLATITKELDRSKFIPATSISLPNSAAETALRECDVNWRLSMRWYVSTTIR